MLLQLQRYYNKPYFIIYPIDTKNIFMMPLLSATRNGRTFFNSDNWWQKAISIGASFIFRFNYS
jgi:hypothetical protein